MKYAAFVFLTALFATITTGNATSLPLLEELEQVQLDYNLENSKHRATKLQEMLDYEDIILNLLKRENDKYDQLVAELASTQPDSSKFERLDRELSKQKSITLKLLNKAEAVSRYIRWLRS